MNKILLIPGSFNPITNAHVDMALAAKNAVNADMIYFIPAHDTYVAKKRTLIPGYCRVSLINSMPNCDKNNMRAFRYILNRVTDHLLQSIYINIRLLTSGYKRFSWIMWSMLLI